MILFRWLMIHYLQTIKRYLLTIRKQRQLHRKWIFHLILFIRNDGD